MSQTRRMYGSRGSRISSRHDADTNGPRNIASAGIFSTKPWDTRHPTHPLTHGQQPAEGMEWRRERVTNYEIGEMYSEWIQIPTAESLQREADLAAAIVSFEIEAAAYSPTEPPEVTSQQSARLYAADLAARNRAAKVSADDE